MTAAGERTDCERVEVLLSDYLDGELGDEGLEAVDHHLRLCPGCARLAEELAVILLALRALRCRA